MFSMILKCEHSALYCATQGHSMLNLRNTLPVLWRYELCEDTEASQCTLNAIKTEHFITKYSAFKSSYVCNMVKYVIVIIVVRFQLLLEDCLFLVQNQTGTVQNGTKCREIMSYVVDVCYAWCLLISEIRSLIVLKFNKTVQAILCAFCDIIFLKIWYLHG